MIVSHKHRYVFVQFPRTGSTAIGNELIANYDGIPILKRHSTYDKFLRAATADETSYRVFSCVRHPLDRTVSMFFKFKSDHRDMKARFTRSWKECGFNPLVWLRFRYFRKRIEYAQRPEVTFSDYFRRYFKSPYSDWTLLDHHRFDALIHFENLSNEFRQSLLGFGIEPVRDLPHTNPTADRKQTYADYFDEGLIPIAQREFAVFMDKTGYAFPQHWPTYTISRWDRFRFWIHHAPRSLYWRLLQ
jgi:hypothetical protein